MYFGRTGIRRPKDNDLYFRRTYSTDIVRARSGVCRKSFAQTMLCIDTSSAAHFVCIERRIHLKTE